MNPSPGSPEKSPAEKPTLSRWRAHLALVEPFKSPLARAAAAGDLDTLAHLLTASANPNAQGLRGMTALHHAALRGQWEAVALLLAKGANPDLRDRAGRAPLAAPQTPLEDLHRIRQAYHRRREKDATWTPNPSAEARSLAEKLETDGIARLPGFVPADALAKLREGFAGFISSLEAKLARGEGRHRHYDEEEHYWESDLAFVCNNAFKYSAELARVASSDTLLDAAGLYLGRRAYVQRAVAMRYLPSPHLSNDMFGWHHDLEEKRFKIMVLLTDVPVGGQHMSFVLGSHRARHPYSMFFRNSCPLEYCESYLPEIRIFDATGRAGDVFVFDSNGAHRGNRRPEGPMREVFMLEYTADSSHIWGGDLPAEFAASLPTEADHPFRRFMRAEKPWEKPARRKFPSWVENLPNIRRWL